MNQFLNRHSLTIYYILAIILSLSLLFLHFVIPVGDYAISFPQYGPTLALLLFVLFSKDKTILKSIKEHLTLKHLKFWILPALLIPVILVYLSGIILSYFNIPFVTWNGDALFFIGNGIFILLGAAGEELGWRGFMLPRLQKKYTPLVSSIILGTLWGVWHLNFTGGALGFLLYTLTMIETSIIMTWIYQHTRHNVLLMILYHFAFNVGSRWFLWERFQLELFIVESIVFGVACLVILLFDHPTMLRRQKKEA